MAHEHQSNDSIPTSSQNQPTPSPAVKWWEPQYGNNWESQTGSEKKNQKSDPIHQTEPKAYSSDQYAELTEKAAETIAMILKKIVTSPFVVLRQAIRWMFSFETYWLWWLGHTLHLVIQVSLMLAIFFWDFDTDSSWIIQTLREWLWFWYVTFKERLIMAAIVFVIIRIIFEFLLVILSINDSLGKIRDSITKKSSVEI